jgi:hypothetical protein
VGAAVALGGSASVGAPGAGLWSAALVPALSAGAGAPGSAGVGAAPAVCACALIVSRQNTAPTTISRRAMSRHESRLAERKTAIAGILSPTIIEPQRASERAERGSSGRQRLRGITLCPCRDTRRSKESSGCARGSLRL